MTFISQHRSRKIRFCSGVCHLLLDALPEVIEDSSAADTKDTKHKSNSEDLARKESEKFFEIVSGICSSLDSYLMSETIENIFSDY